MAGNQVGKVLRLGVIQGGKIIEDRTLDRRENVTIGIDGKNTVVVPMSNLPKTLTVFEVKGQQYSLCFTEKMEGKLSLATGNDQLSFAALKSQGLAKKRGENYVVQISDSSKGKLSLGEVTLLFQFVSPPKPAPKMELPAAARGSLFNTIDRTFTGILLFFLIVEFASAFALSTRQISDDEITLDELPDRFVKMVIPEKPKEAPKVVDQGDKPAEAKKEDEPAKGEKKPQAGPKDEASRKAALNAKVASKGLLKILGAQGGAGSGAIEDVLGMGGASTSVADALAGASGVTAATGDNLAGGNGAAKGGGNGQIASVGDLKTGGGGAVDTGTKREVAVRGKVFDSSAEVESGDVDRDKLNSFVKVRLKSIQGCYERELKRNPSLKGRIVVRFTISSSGRVTEVDIDENSMGDDEVGNCIRATVRAWSTPFKPDGDVTVSYPFVFAPAS